MRQRSVLLVAAISLLAGCSLLGSFSKERCSTDADCERLGLATYACIANNCELRTKEDAGEDAPVVECTTNEECTARKNDVPTACVANRCVGVEIDGVCALLQKERFRTPGSIVLGAFVETNPNVAPGAQIIELAAQEINSAGGVPSPTGPRYVSVVACDKSTPAKVTQGATHLLTALKVPAVFGPVETDEIKGMIAGAKASDTLLVSTLANDATVRVAQKESDGLLWFATDDIARTAAAFNPLLAAVEAKARARNGDLDIRVALLETSSFETTALATTLSTELRFNGRTPVANGVLFRHIRQIPSAYRTANPAYLKTIDEIVAFEPDVIVAVNGDELTRSILPGVEGKWLASSGRPFWIASQLTRFNVELYQHVNTYAGLLDRFFGVDFSGDPTLFAAYDQRLSDRLSATPDAPREGQNVLYDVTYLVSLAARAALLANKPIGGRALAEGLKRLVTGEKGYVGAQPVPGRATFVDIVQGLGNPGKTYQLVGTTGPLDLSPDTGDRVMRQSVFCVQRPPATVPRFRYYSVDVELGPPAKLVPAALPSGTPCLP